MSRIGVWINAENEIIFKYRAIEAIVMIGFEAWFRGIGIDANDTGITGNPDTSFGIFGSPSGHVTAEIIFRREKIA